MGIIPLTHKHAKSYLIGDGQGWLLFDALWPDSFAAVSAQLKENGLRVRDIRYLVVSHFHMDHAGLAQVMKNGGATLLLHECQSGGIRELNDFFVRKPDRDYTPILEGGNRVVTSRESRALLAGIGLVGEIIPTPGHSTDSVSLVLDGDCAFIGDLPTPDIAEAYGSVEMDESWRRIRACRVRTIYPAHALVQEL